MYLVYVILVDGLPRYYGVGSKRRAVAQLQVYRPIITTLLPRSIVTMRILRWGLTREKAIAVEKKLIAACPKGQLWNRNGGGGGCSAEVAREVSKRPSVRRKNSQRLKAKWADPEWRARNLAARKGKQGRVISPEQRKIMADGMRRFHASLSAIERSKRAAHAGSFVSREQHVLASKTRWACRSTN